MFSLIFLSSSNWESVLPLCEATLRTGGPSELTFWRLVHHRLVGGEGAAGCWGHTMDCLPVQPRSDWSSRSGNPFPSDSLWNVLTGTVVAGAVSGGRNCSWNMGLWGTDWGKKCHGYGVMVGRQREEMPREYGVMIVWSRLGRNKGGGNQGRGCCEGRAHTQWLRL